MIYRSQDEKVHTWYATLENINGWKISKSKGVKLPELQMFLKNKSELYS